MNKTNKTPKNAIIINGRMYAVRRPMFNPVCMEDVCHKCDLKRRCDNNQSCFCAAFEKKGIVPYFKRITP